MKKAIDVSDYQGAIDWGKVKSAGIDYAIIKSSLGSDLPSQVDAFFHQNVKACIKNNIDFGTYHFAYFVNEKQKKRQILRVGLLRNISNMSSLLPWILRKTPKDTLRAWDMPPIGQNVALHFLRE